MARWMDGTAPVGGGDPLSGGAGHAAALRAEDRADALAVRAGSDPLAVGAGSDALAVSAGWDALAVGAGSDALAVPAASHGRADPLIGYADATLLLGRAGVSVAPPVVETGAHPRTAAPRTAPQRTAPPGAAPPRTGARTSGQVPHWARRSPTEATRGAGAPPVPRAGRGDRPTIQARPPAGWPTQAPVGPRSGRAAPPKWAVPPRWATPPGGPTGRGNWTAGWTEQAGGRPGGPSLPAPSGPRPDAISWSELTIRGRATANRRPAPPRPPAPPPQRGGSGWDSFFSGAGQPGGRPPWTTSGRPPWHPGGRPSPQSFRDLLDLLRRALRGS